MNKLTKKKLLIISLGFLVFNLILTVILLNLDNSTYEHLDGSEVTPRSTQLIRAVVVGQIISVPLFSLLIGLVVAIFVDKNIPYSQRIVRCFLLTLMTIYGFYSLMGLIKIVRFL